MQWESVTVDMPGATATRCSESENGPTTGLASGRAPNHESMSTHTPAEDNASATTIATDDENTPSLHDIAMQSTANGADGDLLCWRSYQAAIWASHDSLELASKGDAR